MSLNSERIGIKKLPVLSDLEFFNFIKKFYSCIDTRTGKVNPNKCKILEKIDGQAFHIAYNNGELFFENSHSGLLKVNEITGFVKDYVIEINQVISPFIQSVFEEVKNLLEDDITGIKLNGELIFVKDNDENGTVTPVCATYDIKHFGSVGGMCLFNVQVIKNDKLYDIFNIEDKVEDIICSKLGTSEFNFIKSASLVLNDKFTIDFHQMDRSQITKNLEDQISAIHGNLSSEGSLIEGIVFKFADDFPTYGLFSSKYKEKKFEYRKDYEHFEALYNKYLRLIFGVVTKRAIYQRLQKDYRAYEEVYRQVQNNLQNQALLSEINEAYNKLLRNDCGAPKATWKAQMFMADKMYVQFKSQTFDQFVTRYSYESN